ADILVSHRGHRVQREIHFWNQPNPQMKLSFYSVFSVLSVAIGLVGTGLFAVAPAEGPNYPARPIRIIALSSPASGPDIVGRLIGSKLTEAWGQQVIVGTRPGRSGLIGHQS